MKAELAPAEQLARLRLARTDGIGPVGFRRLLARHGTGVRALAALPAIGARRQAPFRIPAAAEAEREMAALARFGGRWLHLGHPPYPALLALAEDAPPVLAMLGDPAAFAPRAVAMVGARNASAHGRAFAERLAEALAAAGLTVVSGLARGIDTAAHVGALRARVAPGTTGGEAGAAGGGRTIAAVAGGLDVPYPTENTGLQARIVAEGGAVLAEAPLGTAPLARHFPRRNRIIAGLALGVVVIEAGHQSGTLITARLALELGREIYAVPGAPLDPRSRGTNDLIRQGAHLTETAEDVLEHLPEAPRDGPLFAPAAVPRPAEDAEETALAAETPPDESDQVLELLGPSPVTVDDLSRRCHLSASALQAILLDLELAGRVALLPGNRVALAVPG